MRLADTIKLHCGQNDVKRRIAKHKKGMRKRLLRFEKRVGQLGKYRDRLSQKDRQPPQVPVASTLLQPHSGVAPWF